MKDGDRVKAIAGQFMGREGEIFVTCIVSELFDMSDPKGTPPKNSTSSLNHFIVRQKDGSYFPAYENELEPIT